MDAFTLIGAGALTYQLAAYRFRWRRISHMWPLNVVVTLAYVAHFLYERRTH